MTLEQAHEPVPYFNEKLLKSVERTLKRFEPNEPFERTSWGESRDRGYQKALVLMHDCDAQRLSTTERCFGTISPLCQKEVGFPMI